MARDLAQTTAPLPSLLERAGLVSAKPAANGEHDGAHASACIFALAHSPP